ncbi:MAG: GumC family protein [Bacteroidales bacterium]|jgi:uncharacterized protein involved in exopolysaccharide biosynthesis
MKVVFFIRLLWRHAALLIVTPVLFAVIVFFLTQNQKREYVSSTKVYTGFTTGSSLSALEDIRVDFYGTKASFDNLMEIITSRNTAEEVGLIMFTRHMLLDGPVKEEISVDSYSRLMQIVPEEVKRLVVKEDFKKTYENFKEYKERSFSNFIYGLINYEHPHYASKNIRKSIKVQRLQSSDLIEIVYTSDDPGISFQGLKILNDLFLQTYSQLKINQTGVVADYFESQLDKATEKLQGAEEELLDFNKRSNIINYQEQTKHIASEKESFSLEYSRIRMEYASASSVLKVLESKMTPPTRTRLNSADILELRSKLSDATVRLSMKNAQLQSFENDPGHLLKEIATINKELSEIQDKLSEKVTEQYNMEYSTESIPVNKLLQDWLTTLVQMESARAKLSVGELRLKEIDSLYSIYAPMGATMKSLERKITVSENEYLSLLNSLGSAKLRQQNVELNSNLRIIDQPLFPLGPQPGKRKYILIFSVLIGFFMPASSIIALELLDRTIKRVKRAREMTKLNVVAPLPNLSNGSRDESLSYTYSKGIDLIVNKILLEHFNSKIKDQVFKILLYSHYKGEGKSLVAKNLGERLSTLGYRVSILSHEAITADGPVVLNYNDKENITKKNISDFFDIEYSPNNFDFILIEIPSVIDNLKPLALIKEADLLFMVLRANRSWDCADIEALNSIKDAKLQQLPEIILNGVEVDEMESFLGDYPKLRSGLRRFVKNILRFRFYSKNNFLPNKKV